MKIILEIPEANSQLRADRITSLKKAVSEGTYKIKSEEIARKILKEIVFELHREIHRKKGIG